MHHLDLQMFAALQGLVGACLQGLIAELQRHLPVLRNRPRQGVQHLAGLQRACRAGRGWATRSNAACGATGGDA